MGPRGGGVTETWRLRLREEVRNRTANAPMPQAISVKLFAVVSFPPCLVLGPLGLKPNRHGPYNDVPTSCYVF